MIQDKYQGRASGGRLLVLDLEDSGPHPPFIRIPQTVVTPLSL